MEMDAVLANMLSNHFKKILRMIRRYERGHIFRRACASLVEARQGLRQDYGQEDIGLSEGERGYIKITARP